MNPGNEAGRNKSNVFPQETKPVLAIVCHSQMTACGLYRVRQKYLTIFQNSCEWNRWRGEFVLERLSSEAQSISFGMERWSVEHRAFAMETYLKKQRFCLDSGYFVGPSIFIGTSVPSLNTSSSEDISRASCTKRNQGQRWI